MRIAESKSINLVQFEKWNSESDGAIAVAVAAYLAYSKSVVTPEDYYLTLQKYLEPKAEEFLSLIKQPLLPLAIYLIPLRNLMFLAIVLVHTFRRLFPPY